jgi:hypothetical protein
MTAIKRDRRDRHGQTISSFPRRKPATSGKRKQTPVQPVAWPRGYFLELVVRFDWPPGFVPGVYTSSAASAAAATRTAEARKGHAGHALNLPGATKFGPVGKM